MMYLQNTEVGIFCPHSAQQPKRNEVGGRGSKAAVLADSASVSNTQLPEPHSGESGQQEGYSRKIYAECPFFPPNETGCFNSNNLLEV